MSADALRGSDLSVETQKSCSMSSSPSANVLHVSSTPATVAHVPSLLVAAAFCRTIRITWVMDPKAYILKQDI
ncbi:hypothetical protein DsansV1_C10g0104941 [Dioscorea sansibarensis]